MPKLKLLISRKRRPLGRKWPISVITWSLSSCTLSHELWSLKPVQCSRSWNTLAAKRTSKAGSWSSCRCHRPPRPSAWAWKLWWRFLKRSKERSLFNTLALAFGWISGVGLEAQNAWTPTWLVCWQWRCPRTLRSSSFAGALSAPIFPPDPSVFF